MRCRQCQRTWVVETLTAEAVISQNHTFLNPGHKTVTAWQPAEMHADAIA